MGFRILNLFIFKHIADGFNESLQPLVGKETDFTDLVVWMSVNYVSNAVTAIRRLGDGSNDVISLHRLLDDVRKHSDVVTPENLSKYRGDIGPWKPKGSIAESCSTKTSVCSAPAEIPLASSSTK